MASRETRRYRENDFHDGKCTNGCITERWHCYLCRYDSFLVTISLFYTAICIAFQVRVIWSSTPILWLNFGSCAWIDKPHRDGFGIAECLELLPIGLAIDSFGSVFVSLFSKLQVCKQNSVIIVTQTLLFCCCICRQRQGRRSIGSLSSPSS